VNVKNRGVSIQRFLRFPNSLLQGWIFVCLEGQRVTEVNAFAARAVPESKQTDEDGWISFTLTFLTLHRKPVPGSGFRSPQNLW
jgi:hypothetical protein